LNLSCSVNTDPDIPLQPLLARTANRGLQWNIGIGVDGDKIEFKLGRNDRLPPALLVFTDILFKSWREDSDTGVSSA